MESVFGLKAGVAAVRKMQGYYLIKIVDFKRCKYAVWLKGTTKPGLLD